MPTDKAMAGKVRTCFLKEIQNSPKESSLELMRARHSESNTLEGHYKNKNDQY